MVSPPAPSRFGPDLEIKDTFVDIQPHSPENHSTGFVRRRCRNPRCGARLKRETDDAPRAFCSRSCFEQFHRAACIVCGRALRSKGRRPQRFCRQKCKLSFTAILGVFWLAGVCPLLPSLARYEMGSEVRILRASKSVPNVVDHLA